MKRIALLVLAACAAQACAAETWFDALVKLKEQARPGLAELKKAVPLPDFGTGQFTVIARVRTKRDGTIAAKTLPDGPWVNGGKSLFIRAGRVCYDVGWVGCVTGRTRVADGKWHHVALTGGGPLRIYVDGKLDATGGLERRADPKGSVLKLGNTSTSFPANSPLVGELDDVRVYGRALSAGQIREHYEKPQRTTGGGLLACWRLDGDGRDASGCLNHAVAVGKVRFVDGKVGQALSLDGSSHLAIASGVGESAEGRLWSKLTGRFTDATSRRQMAWERADGIWGHDWQTVRYAEAARRYVEAAARYASVDKTARRLPAGVRGPADLNKVRAIYLAARRRAQLLERLSEYRLGDLRGTINDLYGDGPAGRNMLARLDALEATAAKWKTGPPDGAPLEKWAKAVEQLRRDVTVNRNPLIDFDEVVFVKRHTYSANHYYTEFINSKWMPGGNLCVLNLKDGSVRELAGSLKGGVFERFDVSFDARRIVFAWKKAWQEGYRIYEVNVDGSGLRQLTFPQADESRLVELYRARPHYHHGTDDMHPCYLPDGGICFISTRCQYGILCDAPDDFTTTVLYRMDADGKNMKKLTNSSVSEASPVMLPDGRILYTRWEYLDKGAVSLKCLWAVRPDGSMSSEIYAADISLPPTFIYGRPIPDAPNQYVVLGTPHCPQNGIGTVIRLNMDRNIRTREPMTYMTPQTDIQAEGGFSFRSAGGPWRRDGRGRGPLFKDPYPLSERYFLVAHKPAGAIWTDPKGYGLYLLDETGAVQPIYRDPAISCWQPMPLKPRKRPPVLNSPVNEELARKNLAACVVADVYRGLAGVRRGEIKYIRVLEQIPRPWATRRRWGGDGYDQQHACITKDTHLGLKVQHGIVPVEPDGSAYFLVPANANISLHVLDENYMAVQKERTYVNYMPGEQRSCVGCHEIPTAELPEPDRGSVMALRRSPSIPGPQPGEPSGRRPLYYATDVQPVFDKHCRKCHTGEEPKGGLNLGGEMTALFNVSYESLIPERRRRPRLDRGLLGPVIGENHPKTGNVHYLPARSLGSHASVLVAMLSKGKVTLRDGEQAARAARLAKVHEKIHLSQVELLKITNWVDTNGQYYGAYWGRRNLRYKDHPNFRPVPTFQTAVSMTSPIPEEQR